MGLAAVTLVAGASGALAESAHTAKKVTTLSACVKAKGGTMYMAKRCDKGDKRVTWSITGPRGLTGARGLQGLTGAQGVPGTSGTTTVAAPSPTITANCPSNGAVASISAGGASTCNHVQYYTGRITLPEGEATNDATVVSVPGIATLEVTVCSASQTEAQLTPPGTTGTTDIWAQNSSGTIDGFYGENWTASATVPLTSSGPTSNGETWHLGTGSGSSAETVTITESGALAGGDCVFQATAQVVDGS